MTKIAGSGSASGSISQRYGSAGPDPPQNVMDPQHCSQDPLAESEAADQMDRSARTPLFPFSSGSDLSWPSCQGCVSLSVRNRIHLSPWVSGFVPRIRIRVRTQGLNCPLILKKFSEIIFLKTSLDPDPDTECGSGSGSRC
jgi:hypothetical protein